jgi:hypothetical protein
MASPARTFARARDARRASAAPPPTSEQNGIERQPPLHDLATQRAVHGRRDVDRERESIEQLRAQPAFFRIHAADEHELRLLRRAEAVALEHVDAARHRVEQRIREMVRQQIDLIDVEHAAMRLRQHPRLQRRLAFHRALDVETAEQPILRRTDRQIDERRRLTHECAQGTRRGRLARALVSTRQHTEMAVDGRELERELQRIESDERGERKQRQGHREVHREVRVTSPRASTSVSAAS